MFHEFTCSPIPCRGQFQQTSASPDLGSVLIVLKLNTVVVVVQTTLTALTLPLNQLTGTIASEIGAMTILEDLDLSSTLLVCQLLRVRNQQVIPLPLALLLRQV